MRSCFCPPLLIWRRPLICQIMLTLSIFRVGNTEELLPNSQLCCDSLAVRATSYALLVYTLRREAFVRPIVRWINTRSAILSTTVMLLTLSLCTIQQVSSVNKVRDDLFSFLPNFPAPCPLPSSLIQSTVLEFFPIFILIYHQLIMTLLDQLWFSSLSKVTLGGMGVTWLHHNDPHESYIWCFKATFDLHRKCDDRLAFSKILLILLIWKPDVLLGAMVWTSGRLTTTLWWPWLHW